MRWGGGGKGGGEVGELEDEEFGGGGLEVGD